MELDQIPTHRLPRRWYLAIGCRSRVEVFGGGRCYWFLEADKKVEVLHITLMILCNIYRCWLDNSESLPSWLRQECCGQFLLNAHYNLCQRVLEVRIKHHMKGTSKIVTVPLDEKGLQCQRSPTKRWTLLPNCFLVLVIEDHIFMDWQRYTTAVRNKE